MPIDTELKSLQIDRSHKQRDSGSPALKYALFGVIGLVLLVSAVLAYQKLTAPIPVTTVPVASPVAEGGAGQESVLSATGYIIAAHKIEVASKVVGRVDWIGVEKGDHVKAGQILVRLEADEYRAQVKQQQGQLDSLQAHLAELRNGSRPEEVSKARADRDQAKADVGNANVTLARTKQLVSEGVMAKQALDDAQAKYDGAVAKLASFDRTLDLSVLGPRKEEIAQVEGQIEQARGALDYAKTQLDNTVIKAPETGTILDRNVERGEFVTNGFVGDKGAKGYLVTMADLNDLQVELDISQGDFPKLGPQQKGVITTDAYPDRKYQGHVEQVSPEADRAKATVQVKVRVENPDSYLRPDMNATVNFYNEAKPEAGEQRTRNIVVIPPSAVQNGAVFVVADGRARRRAVTTGGSSDKGVIVENGLIGGEDLIVTPPAGLKDGQRVEVKK